MKSGIYKIINKINGKYYIGSSKDISNRIKQHFHNLRHDKHINPYLQRSYNKYGDDAFYHEVVEYVNDHMLFEAEERHISTSDKELLYNIGAVGGGDNISDHPNKEDIIQRISSSMILHIASLSDAEKEHRSSIMRADLNPNYGNRWNDEQRAEVSTIVKQKFADNPSRAEEISIRMKAK